VSVPNGLCGRVFGPRGTCQKAIRPYGQQLTTR